MVCDADKIEFDSALHLLPVLKLQSRQKV
jgi:hypothetical protein